MKQLSLISILAIFCVSVFAAPSGADPQQRAIEMYPDLGVKGSPLNKKFLEEIKQRQQSNPAFFKDAEWPIKLAKDSAVALGIAARTCWQAKVRSTETARQFTDAIDTVSPKNPEQQILKMVAAVMPTVADANKQPRDVFQNFVRIGNAMGYPINANSRWFDAGHIKLIFGDDIYPCGWMPPAPYVMCRETPLVLAQGFLPVNQFAEVTLYFTVNGKLKGPAILEIMSDKIEVNLGP